MTKIKKIHILVFLGMLAFGSCKKGDNNSNEPIKAICRVVSIKEDDNPTTFTYDGNGKVSKVTNLYGFGTGTFIYQSNTVNFTDATGKENQSFNIDASGRIIADQFDTYKYNSEGYLIEKYWNSLSITIPDPDYS